MSRAGRRIERIPLVTIRPWDASETPRWPAVDGSGAGSVDPVETVLCAGKTNLRFYREGSNGKFVSTWEPMEVGESIITDRRAVYWLKKFDIGSFYGYNSFTIGSRLLAKGRRRDSVAVGQVRYEWVSAVVNRRSKVLIGSDDYYLGFDVVADGQVTRVELHPYKGDGDLAAAVAMAAAALRQLPGPPEVGASSDGHQAWRFAPGDVPDGEVND